MTRKLLLLTLILLASTNVLAQEETPTNFPRPNELPSIINATEYDKKNIGMTMPDETVVYKSTKQLDEQVTKGVRLYHQQDYERAYPLLSEAALWGLKTPQSMVGVMYTKGLHVEQSIERGMAWLGVANEKGRDKNAKKMFKSIYKQLDSKQQAYVDELVDNYTQRYGLKAQNIICKKKRLTGSNIPTRICAKKPGSTSFYYPMQ